MNEDDIIQDGEKDGEGNVWYNGEIVQKITREDPKDAVIRQTNNKLFNLFDAAQEAGEDKYVGNTEIAKELIEAFGTVRSREIGKLLLEAEI